MPDNIGYRYPHITNNDPQLPIGLLVATDEEGWKNISHNWIF
jgi:hypothetical protein